MKLRKLSAITVILAAFAFPVALVADDRPSTGRALREFAPLDQVVNEFMDKTGIQAGVFALIANTGRRPIVYARGYGWSDEDKKVKTRPDTMFRIASVTKPITAAIVRSLVRERRFRLDMPAFSYLGVQPYNGEVGDKRLALVTVDHLLNHRGGWDKEQTFDPMYRLRMIENELQLTSPLKPINVVEFMMSHPLQFTPGEKRVYSNFGYLVLGRIIEKATKKNFGYVLKSTISRPLGVRDIQLSTTDPKQRNPKEVYYPQESELDIALRDSAGGIAASAPSLCKFLQFYWINGDLRSRQETRRYHHFGSLPKSTTALVEQRQDGIDYVVLFNGRRRHRWQEDNKLLRESINRAIDEIKRQSL